MIICLSHILYTLHFVYEHVTLLREERKEKNKNKKEAGHSLHSSFQASNSVHTFLHNVGSVDILKKCGYCVK